METTQPVCEDNKLLYATPCHAGCVNQPDNQVTADVQIVLNFNEFLSNK